MLLIYFAYYKNDSSSILEFLPKDNTQWGRFVWSNYFQFLFPHWIKYMCPWKKLAFQLAHQLPHLCVTTSVQSFNCFIFLTFFYCCSSTSVSISPHLSPHPSYPHFLPLILTLFGFVHESFIHVPETIPPFPPMPPSHLPSGYCHLFLISMSLVKFCLFVLLIRFHLKVRSYGICPSLPGLFHLA